MGTCEPCHRTARIRSRHIGAAFLGLLLEVRPACRLRVFVTGGILSAGCCARHPHTFPTTPSHSSRDGKAVGTLSADTWKWGGTRLGVASYKVLATVPRARYRAVSTLPGPPCLPCPNPLPLLSVHAPLTHDDPKDAKTCVHVYRWPRNTLGRSEVLGPGMTNA